MILINYAIPCDGLARWQEKRPLADGLGFP